MTFIGNVIHNYFLGSITQIQVSNITCIKYQQPDNSFLNIALVCRPHNLYDNTDVKENNEKLCKILRLLPKPFKIVGDFNYF